MSGAGIAGSRGHEGRAMPIHLLARSRAAGVALVRALRREGLRTALLPLGEAAQAAEASTSDGPLLVIVETELWDVPATTTVAELRARALTVFAICAAARDPAIRATILASGVAEVFPDDERTPTALTAAVRWWTEQQQPSTVRLGQLLFDPMGDALLTRSARVPLTRKESQLLWQVHVMGEAGTVPCSAAMLALRLHTTASAIGNHAHAVREKIESVLGQPRVLWHDRVHGYYLALQPRERSDR